MHAYYCFSAWKLPIVPSCCKVTSHCREHQRALLVHTRSLRKLTRLVLRSLTNWEPREKHCCAQKTRFVYWAVCWCVIGKYEIITACARVSKLALWKKITVEINEYLFMPLLIRVQGAYNIYIIFGTKAEKHSTVGGKISKVSKRCECIKKANHVDGNGAQWQQLNLRQWNVRL